MSDRIKKLKIKKQDGTFSDYIPISADAENIDTTDGESVQLKLNKKPYYYNTVADMKADNKLKAGDMAITLGYYTANDDGGAEYKITSDIDENNYQEVLNNELYANLIYNTFITPETFGAIGDGINDDTLMLQKAIDYGYNNKIKVLLTKTYLITSGIKVYGIAVTANDFGSYIIGNGNAHIKAGSVIDNIIELSPKIDNERTYGIKIKDITLDGLNQTNNGIYSNYSTSECTFENITINQCSKGIWINGNCYLNNFTNIRPYHCIDYGIYFTNGNNTSNVFTKCYVDTCKNAYHINGQYSTMISCCADGITERVFDLNSFTGCLIGCGSESNNFESMFYIGRYSEVSVLGGMFWANPNLNDKYYITVALGSTLYINSAVLNYQGSNSTGALIKTYASAILKIENSTIYDFTGTNSIDPASKVFINRGHETKTQSVTLDENNTAVLDLSPYQYHLLDIACPNRSGWIFITYLVGESQYKVKVLANTEYNPSISDKNFTFKLTYIDKAFL